MILALISRAHRSKSLWNVLISKCALEAALILHFRVELRHILYDYAAVVYIYLVDELTGVAASK